MISRVQITEGNHHAWCAMLTCSLDSRAFRKQPPYHSISSSVKEGDSSSLGVPRWRQPLNRSQQSCGQNWLLPPGLGQALEQSSEWDPTSVPVKVSTAESREEIFSDVSKHREQECTSSTWEVKAGGTEVQSHSLSQDGFKANPRHTRPCLGKKRKRKENCVHDK